MHAAADGEGRRQLRRQGKRAAGPAGPAALLACKGQPLAEPVEIKKLELWTKKGLPERLKLRSANLTKKYRGGLFYDFPSRERTCAGEARPSGYFAVFSSTPAFWRAWRLIASKLSALMTCSIRQASPVATEGVTPSAVSQSDSRVCRS